MKKKTFTTELFIHMSQYGTGQLIVSQTDMTSHGYVLLGSQTVELDIPATDPVQAEVDMLEKKVVSTRAQFQSDLNQLEQRIQELKCLEVK